MGVDLIGPVGDLGLPLDPGDVPDAGFADDDGRADGGVTGVETHPVEPELSNLRQARLDVVAMSDLMEPGGLRPPPTLPCHSSIITRSLGATAHVRHASTISVPGRPVNPSPPGGGRRRRRHRPAAPLELAGELLSGHAAQRLFRCGLLWPRDRDRGVPLEL